MWQLPVVDCVSALVLTRDKGHSQSLFGNGYNKNNKPTALRVGLVSYFRTDWGSAVTSLPVTWQMFSEYTGVKNYFLGYSFNILVILKMKNCCVSTLLCN